jgi:hypothetical protein
MNPADNFTPDSNLRQRHHSEHRDEAVSAGEMFCNGVLAYAMANWCLKSQKSGKQPEGSEIAEELLRRYEREHRR